MYIEQGTDAEVTPFPHKGTSLQGEKKESILVAHFLSHLLHDLRGSINTIGMFSQLLQRQYEKKLDSTAFEYFGYIDKSAKAAATLIEAIQTYSDILLSSSPIQAVNCGELIQSVLQSFAKPLGLANTTFTIGRLPIISSNYKSLFQLFSILMDNCIKYKGEERLCIEVSAVPNGSKWQFSVSDNGVGIEPSEREMLFNLGARGSKTRDLVTGNGFGLFFAKSIVEKLGGKIWFEPDNLIGTRVSFVV